MFVRCADASISSIFMEVHLKLVVMRTSAPATNINSVGKGPFLIACKKLPMQSRRWL